MESNNFARKDDGRCDDAAAVGETRLKVFDLHCDTLDRLCLSGDPTVPGGFYEHDAGVPRERMSRLDDNDAHISLGKMAPFRWCQCFAVFVPDELRGEQAWRIFERVEAYWRKERDRCSGALAQVDSPLQALDAFDAGKCAAMLTVEGLSFLEDDGSAASRLACMFDAGVRMATLTWNGPNALGSGNDTDEGLSAFGRSVVRCLEDAAIVVDASHLNQEGFKDLLVTARHPFACSHSNARAVCDHPRNLEDWQLREIADRGGIVGLNFFNDFLVPSSQEAKPDDLFRHIEHMMEVAGEGVVALGSDYDGSDVPPWLSPCSAVETLHGLIAMEFGSDIADKIFWGNAARFFQDAASRLNR